MKNIFALLMFGFTISNHAQNTGVEKTLFGIQTGFAGVWINNETKITNSVALRSEIGIEHDFAVGDHYKDAGFIMQPVINLESRFYYNIEKRNSKGKKTAKNSANYFSIKTSYHPDWFVVNLDENSTKISDLSIIPTWGIKRQIGKHFNFETGIGFGYRVVYLPANYQTATAQSVDNFPVNRGQYTPYLHLRVGYNL